jgi:predicted MFS family arabinose efflux permease
VPAVGLGLARSGYSLVLPDMSASLGRTYAEAGRPSTVNAAGYLCGAVAAAARGALVERPSSTAAATAAVVVVTALQAAASEMVAVSALRSASGAWAAAAFIGGTAAATRLEAASEPRAALHLGLCCSGPRVLPFRVADEDDGHALWNSAWSSGR